MLTGPGTARLLVLVLAGAGIAVLPTRAQQVGPVPPLSGVIVPPLYGQPLLRQAAPRKRVAPRREALPICVERQGIGGSRLVCSRPLQVK